MKRERAKYLTAFCDLLKRAELPKPGPGDCWFCLGRMPSSVDHIIGHMLESYYVPSLMYNAFVEHTKSEEEARQRWMYCEGRSADLARISLRGYFNKRHQAMVFEYEDAVARKKEEEA